MTVAASTPEDVLAVARMVANTKIASELRGDFNSRSDGRKSGEYAVYTISGKTYSVYVSGTLRLDDQNPGTLTLYIRPVGTMDLAKVLVLTDEGLTGEVFIGTDATGNFFRGSTPAYIVEQYDTAIQTLLRHQKQHLESVKK